MPQCQECGDHWSGGDGLVSPCCRAAPVQQLVDRDQERLRLARRLLEYTCNQDPQDVVVADLTSAQLAAVCKAALSADWTGKWYAVRWQGLGDLIRREAPHIEKRACSVMGIGAETGDTPPTYSTIVNRLERDNAQLVDLVKHAQIHSGYRDCGYEQMSKPLKQLYSQITGARDGDT